MKRRQIVYFVATSTWNEIDQAFTSIAVMKSFIWEAMYENITQ